MNLAKQTIDFFGKHPECGIAMSYPGYYIHEKLWYRSNYGVGEIRGKND